MDTIANICWLIAAVAATALILYLFINFLRHQYEFKEYGFRFWKSSYDVQLGSTTLLCFTIFSIHTTVDTAYALIAITTHSFNPLWCISSYIEFGWIAISKLFLYMFFIIRLHVVFNNSTFAVAPIKLKALALFVSIPIIFMSLVGFYQSFEVASHILKMIHLEHAQKLRVHNFAECDILVAQFLPKAAMYAQQIGTAVYILAELIYSIIILRLFLSRVLILSLSFDKMKARLESKPSNSTKNPSSTTSHRTVTPQNSNTTTAKSASSVDGRPSKAERKKIAHSQRMEAKNSELFLNLAIKTSNLIILAICTNYIIVLKFGFNTPTVIVTIDALCNCLAVYLSYEFASKTYDGLFGVCHSMCYGCCGRLCYCCCLPKMMTPQRQMMKMMEMNAVQDSCEPDSERQESTVETGIENTKAFECVTAMPESLNEYI